MEDLDAVTSWFSSSNFTSKESGTEIKKDSSYREGVEKAVASEGILAGAQICPKLPFKNRKGAEISLTPVIVDFRRLLQCKSGLSCSIEVIPGIPNVELLHAVVGLYDVSLTEMTPDVLYNTVCGKGARTIIILRDVKDTLEDLEKKRCKMQKEVSVVEQKNMGTDAAQKDAIVSCGVQTGSLEDNIAMNMEESDEEKDVFEPEEAEPSVFADVYSDTEDEEEEESDEEEEDFSMGFKTFLERVRRRRESRQNHTGPFTEEHVGVENMIVGGATFKKCCCKHLEKVIHLTLITVRKRFRKCGIGKYLLAQIKDTAVVGPYDAVVVHADNSAVEFFERYGFSDDLILNSKWSELADQFTDCTLMSYMPPFTNETIDRESVPELDIIAMEKEIMKWREKSMEAYRSEVICINRLRHEIIQLRALTCSQQQLITSLAAENEVTRREKFLIEKKFLLYRMSTTETLFSRMKVGSGSNDDDDNDSDLDSEKLLHELMAEARLHSPNLSTQASQPLRNGVNEDSESQQLTEVCDSRQTMEEFCQVGQDFCKALSQDPSIVKAYNVTMLQKASLPSSLQEAYQIRIKAMADPHMRTQLYYCGGLERPERLPAILKLGFTEQDFSHGDYGRGLYFSKYPSKAAQFSAFGKILLVEVGLGNTQTVVRKEQTRTSPEEGCNSIITPGRLASSGDSDNLLCQEYVIFDPIQVRPLYLIEYVPKSE